MKCLECDKISEKEIRLCNQCFYREKYYEGLGPEYLSAGLLRKADRVEAERPTGKSASSCLVSLPEIKNRVLGEKSGELSPGIASSLTPGGNLLNGGIA
jgi:hypothetical protein